MIRERVNKKNSNIKTKVYITKMISVNKNNDVKEIS